MNRILGNTTEDMAIYASTFLRKGRKRVMYFDRKQRRFIFVKEDTKWIGSGHLDTKYKGKPRYELIAAYDDSTPIGYIEEDIEYKYTELLEK